MEIGSASPSGARTAFFERIQELMQALKGTADNERLAATGAGTATTGAGGQPQAREHQLPSWQA
eukprot:1882146-Prorocentrum_lima.AAC.1